MRFQAVVWGPPAQAERTARQAVELELARLQAELARLRREDQA